MTTPPVSACSKQRGSRSATSVASTLLLQQRQQQQQQQRLQQQNQLEERRYEHACKIWYHQLPEGKATSEFQALTPQEREQVWADLAGHDLLSRSSQRLQQFSKSPQELQLLLRQLHQRLNLTEEQQQQQQQQQQHNHQDDHDALWMVYQSSPAYVCQQYTKFLASQEWNVDAAYETMQAHFEVKRDLFGKDLLGRDILLSDLDCNTMKCLQSGGYQYSYYSRDRADRSFALLNVSFMTHQNFTKKEYMVR
jgi:regulator of replication initiation timing